MKSIRTLIIGLLATSFISGCGLNSAFDMSKRDTSQNQLCSRLKRNIVFYSMDQNHDTAWSSPAKQADILRQYQQNNCEEILKNSNTTLLNELSPFPAKNKTVDQNHIHVQQE